ncbi:helix-turn-helix domain-containing protein [Methanosarcina sp. KYL-1]|uniref:helix-turn-helix domain-containing protein n=1 Tax=Methanosarcina sp. KYL-1 TaxID=2602068 RepID=UPI00210146F5|nr:helix-turn-helix domain-containing protein [Methanosarcina sp. KYL-1]MCQ1534727.1 helix-turn-helix domain-containing protein [Methanosarcina sp. KYL-1]
MNGLEDKDGFPGDEKLPEGPGLRDQDRVLVLPVNEDSRKITQTLSNETSLKILELLGKKSMSATGIAEELKIPLTTVKYNLDSLVDSDLIKVKQIKWSRKGREVKVYEALEKLIVLVPSRSPVDKISIMNLLQQYIGVIAAAVFAAAGIEYLSAYLKAKRIFDATAPMRMGVMEYPYPESMMAGGNESDNPDPKMSDSVPAYDEEMQENEAVNPDPGTYAGEEADEAVPAEEIPTEEIPTEEALPEEYSVEEAPMEETIMEEPSMEEVPMEEAVSEEPMPERSVMETDTITDTPDAPMEGFEPSDVVQGIPPVPAEGFTGFTGTHGLYDVFSAHPGVWFLFGCIFVIFLLVIREVYYKKKTK